MVSDLLILDNKMLESLKHIQNSYENHKKFLLDFEKGNYTIEQLETFLLKHKQEIS